MNDEAQHWLQVRMLEDIPLAQHLGVRVVSADAGGIVLAAPLAANSNHKGTAFGGSLYSVAVLAGWGLLELELQTRSVDAQIVIQSAQVEYLAPVSGDFSARAVPPTVAELAKCLRTLARYGRARVELTVTVEQGRVEAVRLRGVYVMQK